MISRAEPSRSSVCGHDACELPGFCDGRHCQAAGGHIRLTPEESDADAQALRLGKTLALLRPSKRRRPGSSHTIDGAAAAEAVALIETHLRRAGIAFIDPE